MRNRVHDLQFDQFVRQQAHGPFCPSRRSLPASDGYQPGFGVAVEDAFPRRLGLFLAGQGRLQALHTQPLANFFDRRAMAAEGFGNPLILPPRAIRVSLEQDIG